MNDKLKSVLFELVNKKLRRHINNLSDLQRIIDNKNHSESLKWKKQNHEIDHKRINIEITQINIEIEKLENMIKNIYEEEFGLCTQCGKSISFQRLILNPALKTCFECGI
jgi:RNA polymerase-binding transcription factor DksA